MNLLAHFAILIGRRKFEEFAQANPELPDDALAVANTLDSHSTRGGATLIVGSLAHAADNLLKGTETFDLVAVHASIILCGVCIVLVRHAISKHDVRINAAVQQARTVTGISNTVPLLAVMIGLGALLLGGTGAALADATSTNGTAAAVTTNSAITSVALPATNATSGLTFDLVTSLITVIEKSAVLSSGAGINLHGTIDPLLSQQLSVIGYGNTNAAWQAGPALATFFLPSQNEEQLGFSANWQLWHVPFLSKFLLLNLSEVNGSIYIGEPLALYTGGFKGFDWKQTTAGASLGWKF